MVAPVAPLVVASAIGAAGSLIGGLSAQSKQEKFSREANKIERERNQLERERFQFARQQAQQQWQIYRTKILPIELQAADLGIEARELALRQGQKQAQLYDQFFTPIAQQVVAQAQEGVADRTGRVVSEAAGDVSTQFQRQREIDQRNLSRLGVRPDSGRFAGTQANLGLAEAGARSAAINTARDREQTRQEGTNFNRLVSASNLIRPYGALPSQGANVSGSRSPSFSGANLSSSASTAAAAQFGQQASNAFSGIGNIAQLGIKAYGAGLIDSSGNLT
jgi:hypothetical protein